MEGWSLLGLREGHLPWGGSSGLSRAGGHPGHSRQSLDVWVWDFGLYPRALEC